MSRLKWTFDGSGREAEVGDNRYYRVVVMVQYLTLGPRCGRHLTPIGFYSTVEEAKAACEQMAREGRPIIDLRPEAPEPRLKRPRGALLRAINAGLVSTDDAHRQGYMGKAELEA
jgi:hypothetical protein